jgi:hypothetical protein
LSLIVSAFFFGLLTGMSQELTGYAATGLGRIFSLLAIVVFRGAVLAECLRGSGARDCIVTDLLLMAMARTLSVFPELKALRLGHVPAALLPEVAAGLLNNAGGSRSSSLCNQIRAWHVASLRCSGRSRIPGYEPSPL